MGANPPAVDVRPAATPAEFRACQEAQRLAWGLVDDRDLVPVATLAGAQHHGGLVLGAFLPDGRAVALSFAFLGRSEGKLCLYSQLTGVVPEHQGRGLGSVLKTAQRDFARETGVPWISWAFDPLQAGNAHFNLVKLGATAGRYVVDMYGPRTDALNRNAPTDRLLALWETLPGPGFPNEPKPPAVRTHTIAPPGFRNEPRPRAAAQGLIDPTGPAFVGLPEGDRARLEIPASIGPLRAADPGRAAAWGLAVREAFLRAFAAGYRAVGFDREGPAEERRAFYVLERRGPDAQRGPSGSSSTAAELMQ